MSSIGVLFLLILCVALIVAISRWVFRINDIVKHLQDLNAKMDRLAPKDAPR
jgi:outer membrane murein-binding lipoprotein Lpp